MKNLTKPVTYRAIMSRIQRKLDKEGEGLKLRTTSEKTRLFNTTSCFYLTNENMVIVATHIDIEKIARELGALKSGEEIVYE